MKAKIFLLTFIFSVFAYANSSQNFQNVSLQLQWKHQFEFAGFYMAKEKGYYDNAKLNVTIKEWDHGIDMIKNVLSENHSYAIARPSSLIDICKGSDLVYLAALYQSSPLVVLANKSSNIKTFKDFENKRIMITDDHMLDSSLVSMFSSQGVELKNMKIQKHSFDPKDLIDGKTDLMVSYITNEPFTLKELGGTPVIFNPNDHGFDYYNDILITSRDNAKNNPEEVKNFREASILGFEYAFENIEETVEVILKKYNTQHKTKEMLVFEANELKKLAYNKTSQVGNINAQKLDKLYHAYRVLGLVNCDVNFNHIIYNDLSLESKLT